MRDDLLFFLMRGSEATKMLEWRTPNACRTPWEIRYDDQLTWYSHLDPHREQWWAVYEKGSPGETHVGCVALQHIDWVNGRAEISLVIDPAKRGAGIGSAAVERVLGMAFARYRLRSVWGECYQCSGAVPFWEKVVSRWAPYSHATKIPATKFQGGKLSWSYLFTLMYPGEVPDVPPDEIMHSVTGVV